jgi:hypothetical protein
VSETGTESTNRGCLLILTVVIVLLLILLGLLGIGALLGAWDPDELPTSQSQGPPPPPDPPRTTAVATCADATAAFRSFAGPRPGMSATVLDRVTSVCWEPTGQLRADATYVADVNATSPPLAALCKALSDFVTDSGRQWKGFTVYSASQLTPGKAFLVGATEGGACTNPQHN